MALKYFLDYKDIENNQWRIEIDAPTYTDNPIEMQGEGENVLSIAWGSNSSDDPHAQHVIPSTATIKVYSDVLDLEELSLIEDDGFKTRVYFNNSLFWQGYLVSDGIQRRRQSVSYAIQLQAVDGLNNLNGVVFSRVNNYGAITVNGQASNLRCPMNTIRLIIQASRLLNNPLPIRWMNSRKSEQYPTDDGLAGREEIDSDGDLVLLGGDKSCYWWLESLLKSQYCWIRQISGYWYIINYDDLIANNGVFNGYEIPNVTTSVTATTVSIDLSKYIDTTIGYDSFEIIKNTISKVNVTYQDTTNKNNVVPDSSFDRSTFNMYWYDQNDSAFLSQNDFNLSGRIGGTSLNVDNGSIGSDTESFITFGSIPVDTNILFKNANLGFLWSPISGYPLTTNGNIDFSKFPLPISVKLTINREGSNVDYYLNEFGYWSDKNVQANAQVEATYWQSDFEGSFFVRFAEGGNFFPGDVFEIVFKRDSVDRYYRIVFDETMDITSGINHITSIIPNSSDFGSFPRTFHVNNVDNATTNYARTVKDDNYYKRIQIDAGTQVKYNDIVDIQFQSKGKSSDIKLPENGEILDFNTGMLSIGVFVPLQAEMNIDEFYFNVSDNHDIYELSSTRKGGALDYTMNVSSSFSGHMLSSYMNKYNVANRSTLWNGVKTLTQLYGESALNWLNSPTKIFQGTANGLVLDNGYVEIDSVKYISLGSTLNCHTLRTKLMLFEAKKNILDYEVKHKSSGDS